jgi:hypothetical protein
LKPEDHQQPRYAQLAEQERRLGLTVTSGVAAAGEPRGGPDGAKTIAEWVARDKLRYERE